MSTYLWIMTAGSAAIFALYGLRCAKAERLPELRKNAWPNALLSFVLAATFGTILARVGYALLMSELDFEYDGIEALGLLLEFEIDCVSFFCGAIGVCLGVLLSNRLTRKGSAFVGMDAFAPFGALLAALFRLGELFFGSYGAGGELPEGSPLAFFPFALRIPVAGSSDYWAWAICVLSACFALILFIHVEELLCAIVLAGVMLFWILKSGRTLPFLRRWTPFGILLLCIGLLVATEFAIDGKLFDLLPSVCYLFMIAVLAVIGWAGVVAARRYNEET